MGGVLGGNANSFQGYEIFAWIGKGASTNERKFALQYAQVICRFRCSSVVYLSPSQDYLTRYNRPPYLPITRVMELGESDAFLAALK